MRVQFGSVSPQVTVAKQHQPLQFGSLGLTSDTVMFSSTGVKKPTEPEIKKPKGTNKPKPKEW